MSALTPEDESLLWTLENEAYDEVGAAAAALVRRLADDNAALDGRVSQLLSESQAGWDAAEKYRSESERLSGRVEELERWRKAFEHTSLTHPQATEVLLGIADKKLDQHPDSPLAPILSDLVSEVSSLRLEIQGTAALPAPTAPREAASEATAEEFWTSSPDFKRATPTESTEAKCETMAATGKYCAEWRRLGFVLECDGCRGTTPTSEESK